MFATLLWWVAVVGLCIVTLLLVILAVLIQVLRYQVEKFMFNLPWLKWLTVEDLRALKFSILAARFILPIFKEKGYLEVRLIDEDGLDERESEMVDHHGFHPMTLDLYEFKLTKRKNRKEKWSFSPKDFMPALKPVRS